MLIQDPVRLRAIEREDLPKFVEWLNDPAIRQFVGRFAPISQAAEEQWFARQLEQQDAYRFTIEARFDQEWRPIGICGLEGIDWHVRKVPMGIMIGETDLWGQGFGTVAMTLLLRFAFGELNLNRAELEVLDDNPRAIRCYEKVGFKREVVRREAIFKGGRYRDLIHMGALREEFPCW